MRLRAILAASLLLAVAGVHAQGARDEALRQMTPEQRERLWQSMTPQQRAEFWRQLTPEQRQSIRQQMSPAQQEAMRQRMIDERQRRMQQGAAPAGPEASAPAPEGPLIRPGPGPRRWSLEERQRLREQILESARDLREPPPQMRMEHRKGRER